MPLMQGLVDIGLIALELSAWQANPGNSINGWMKGLLFKTTSGHLRHLVPGLAGKVRSLT